MKNQKTNPFILATGLVICLITAVVLWNYVDQSHQKQIICQQDAIGIWGPVTLSFTETANKASIETRIKIEPEVDGTWKRAEGSLTFLPSRPLNDLIIYHISVDGEDQNSREPLCELKVRKPKILYQSVLMGQGKIFIRDPDEDNPILLVQFDGSILDYQAAWDGSGVAASVKNKTGGSDIWTVSRDGKTKKILVVCGKDECDTPAWFPDSRRIVFSRRGKIKNNEISTRIWLVDLMTGQAQPLMADKTISGINPQISPDGQNIAFYDPGRQGIWIIRESGRGEMQFLQTNTAMFAWSPDSKDLLYFNGGTDLTNYLMNIYLYHLDNQKADILLNEYKEQFEFGKPVWSVDGKWILMNIRYAQGSPGRKLIILSPDGAQSRIIADKQVEIYSSYLWNPDGQSIIYQKMEWGSSTVKPMILEKDLTSDAVKVLVEEGSMPEWLP